MAWEKNGFKGRGDWSVPKWTEKGTVSKHQFVPVKSPRVIKAEEVKNGVQARLGKCERGSVRERNVETSTELRHRLRGVGDAMPPEALIHLVKPFN